MQVNNENLNIFHLMTTRRRRTPSEAGCEETFFATAASILPQSDIQQFNLLPPSSQVKVNIL